MLVGLEWCGGGCYLMYRHFVINASSKKIATFFSLLL